jgi:uncharacterized membrane protein YwzB
VSHICLILSHSAASVVRLTSHLLCTAVTTWAVGWITTQFLCGVPGSK